MLVRRIAYGLLVFGICVPVPGYTEQPVRHLLERSISYHGQELVDAETQLGSVLNSGRDLNMAVLV